MKKEMTIKRSADRQGTLTEGIKDFFKIIWRNKMSRVGLIIVALFILIAIFGPLLVADPVSNFGIRLQAPSAQHWLGTDYAGRDIFSMFIKGTRTVLMVALYAGIFAVVIACGVGITAGLLGGKVDTVLMMITDIVLTMPQFPVIMVLSMVINVSNNILFGLVLGIWSWAALAKAIRTQVLTLKDKDFIEASRIMGISNIDIITKDVLPNIVSFVAINFISIMRGAIVSSVNLMVLGLVPINGTHWGMMLQMAIAQTSLLYGGLQPIVNFMTPIMGILLFQLGCYLFAMGLDEAMNPRLRR